MPYLAGWNTDLLCGAPKASFLQNEQVPSQAEEAPLLFTHLVTRKEMAGGTEIAIREEFNIQVFNTESYWKVTVIADSGWGWMLSTMRSKTFTPICSHVFFFSSPTLLYGGRYTGSVCVLQDI